MALEERLAPHFAACGGDAGRSVELREWNIFLGWTLMRDERTFDPRRPELPPLSADADATRLFRALCPEAAERVLGGGTMTPVEEFLALNPAPAKARLWALSEQSLEQVVDVCGRRSRTTSCAR